MLKSMLGLLIMQLRNKVKYLSDNYLITVTLLEMSSVSFGTGEETIPPKGIWAMSL